MYQTSIGHEIFGSRAGLFVDAKNEKHNKINGIFYVTQ